MVWWVPELEIIYDGKSEYFRACPVGESRQ